MTRYLLHERDMRGHTAHMCTTSFFLSSRRWHTRSTRDWSSDVCSSDLDGGGRTVLDAVLPAYPAVRFLALSVSDAADDVIGVIRGGVRGYVTKAISGAELCEAIARIHAGDAYFSPTACRIRPGRLPGRPAGAVGPGAGSAHPA